jgi:hypothetical protein
MGSFFFIRGLAFFIGGYTNELTIYHQIYIGTATYSTTFVAYFAALAVMMAAAIFY